MYELYICHSWSLFVNIDINVYSRLCHVVSESLYDDDDILLLSTVSHYFVTRNKNCCNKIFVLAIFIGFVTKQLSISCVT